MVGSSSEFEQRIKSLGHGDHVCMIYENQSEQMAAAIPYIAQGLTAGERCFYIADDRTVDEVCAALEHRGVDVAAERRRGSLMVLTKRESYLQQGRFDPTEMVDRLCSFAEEAVTAGYAGFRVTGEMTWALGHETGESRVIEYEAQLNRFFSGSRASAICQYNRQRIPPAILRDVLRTHPQAVLGNQFCSNVYFEPPQFLSNGVYEADRVEWMISQLRRNEQAFQELRCAENALRHSETRYRAMVEATPECVKIVSAQGILLQMNRAGLEMTGADESALGKSVYDVIAPEDRARFRAFNEQICRGETGSLEFDIISATGTRRHMETNAVPLPAEDGGFVHLAVTRDVTSRKAVERARDAHHAEAEIERKRLEDVFRFAPSCMAVLQGPEHIFERANDRYVELVGKRALIGKPVRDALPEIEGQGFFDILDRVYETGEPYVAGEAHVMLDRGQGALEEVILEFVYQPMRDTEGAVTGVIFQGIDQTERRKAEADLADVRAASDRRERLYETILSSTPDLVYVFDLQHRFTYANEALLKMWGRTWDEAIGLNCLELGYEPWHAAMHDREIEQVVATKLPIRGEVPFTGTNGRRIYDYIFVPVLGADGEVEAVAGTTRDVTERRRMEDELRESDRKKDDFLAVLAHELRNPLAPLRNGLQVMRLAGGDLDTSAKARTMMERQLAHMVRLIDDLLDISRISRNKLELRCSRILLSDVIDSAVETARPLIEEAGHQLTLSLPPGPLFLEADLTRLAQVFSNLLTNSAKYTPPGGRIWLTAERTSDGITVTVRDNGMGIPPDSQSSVFDMFSQLNHPGDSKSSGGLGIGLALVKGLVEMHGGTVVCSSEGLSLGSQFTVRLPVSSPLLPTSHIGEAPHASTRNRRRVLVVDDSVDGAESLGMMLRLLGNEVQTAHDGLEAIQRAEAFSPELILMDVGMPRLNGLDATRAIRERSWGRNMKILALTGWGQSVDRQRSQDAGCDGHLVKPVDLAELQNHIERLFPASRS